MRRNAALPFLVLSLTLFAAAVLLTVLSPSQADWEPNPPSPTPTTTQTSIPSQTPTVTREPTFTATFTPTETVTRLPTYTPTPTNTPTATASPTGTLTPTPTETRVSTAPAVLFEAFDADEERINWGYERVSEVRYDSETGQPLQMSAFLAFRLMDRAVHRDTIEVNGRALTLYYLNVNHEFDARTEQVRLIIGGEWGRDVPLNALTTSGSFFTPLLELSAGDVFDPTRIHRAISQDSSALSDVYENIFLTDLAARLERMPERLIVLADSPVLVPASEYETIEWYFDTAPYLAARYFPWVSVDGDGRITGPSGWAQALTSHMLYGSQVPAGPLDFPSQLLVLLPGE